LTLKPTTGTRTHTTIEWWYGGGCRWGKDNAACWRRCKVCNVLCFCPMAVILRPHYYFLCEPKLPLPCF